MRSLLTRLSRYAAIGLCLVYVSACGEDYYDLRSAQGQLVRTPRAGGWLEIQSIRGEKERIVVEPPLSVYIDGNWWTSVESGPILFSMPGMDVLVSIDQNNGSELTALVSTNSEVTELKGINGSKPTRSLTSQDEFVRQSESPEHLVSFSLGRWSSLTLPKREPIDGTGPYYLPEYP